MSYRVSCVLLKDKWIKNTNGNKKIMSLKAGI